jgi:hypothetical protein
MEKTIENAIDHQHQLFRTAFDAYLTELKNSKLEPSEDYLPYDFEEDIDARQWCLPWGIINRMVKGELNELTNDLNEWHDSLIRWYAWNKVIGPYSNIIDAWKLRSEFLGTRIHYCLFQPSSSRDRFTFIITNAMHQVRLMVEKGYQDYLEGDPKTPDNIKKPKYLIRRQKEKRLSKLISIWSEGAEVMRVLQTIDDEAYRKDTKDYRNRHSHVIGPRLGIGHIRFVTRHVSQCTTMTKQPDGTYLPIPTGKMAGSYGSGGGTPPLDLEKAHAANLAQYRRARKCYTSYRKLLAVGLEAMPLR